MSTLQPAGEVHKVDLVVSPLVTVPTLPVNWAVTTHLLVPSALTLQLEVKRVLYSQPPASVTNVGGATPSPMSLDIPSTE